MAWCWHKSRLIDQWNRTESPERKPHICGQLISDKGAKIIQWRKESLFNKCCWENWTATCKWMKVDHYLPPYTKINSKWIKDLNLTLEIIKLLEENIRSTVFDIGLCCTLPNTMSTQARERKEKIYKWDYMRLKAFCKAKEMMNKTKRQGRPRGLMVKCARSSTGGPGSDPGRAQIHHLSGYAEATSHIQ